MSAPSTSSAAEPRKRFNGSQESKAGPSNYLSSGGVPDSILQDEALNAAIAAILPPNYNFEIHKTIYHVRRNGATCVALQMPEGLTLWATGIADIIEAFTEATTVIMGDVTYGACCVDDYTAMALGCDMLVHYGHSCLIPVDQTAIKTLYVFVEIAIHPMHLAQTVRANFPSDKASYRAKVLGGSSSKGKERDEEQSADSAARVEIGIDHEEAQSRTSNHGDGTLNSDESKPTHLALVGTVQFINAIQGLRDALEEPVRRADDKTSDMTERLLLAPGEQSEEKDNGRHTSGGVSTAAAATGAYTITVPQVKPLSPGEILGCTSPRLPSDVDSVIYIGDGRFHLESIMIANPRVPAFRYDPYTKRFVRELYDHAAMRRMRGTAVEEARQSIAPGAREIAASQTTAEAPELSRVPDGPQPGAWGVVLGTLGRQGSLAVLDHLRHLLSTHQSSNGGGHKSAQPIPHIPILLSELSPAKLSLFGQHLDAFIQTSCPRLSIDWGSAFPKPLLSPYEAAVALGQAQPWEQGSKVEQLGMRRDAAKAQEEAESKGRQQRQQQQQAQRPDVNPSNDFEGGDYPMDFYANDSLGPWTPRHGVGASKKKGSGSGGPIGANGVKMSNKALLRARMNRNKDKEKSGASASGGSSVGQEQEDKVLAGAAQRAVSIQS